MGNENYEDFQAAIYDPETVIGMLGDYRAGIAVDQLHDREDRENGRKLQSPLHVIWSLENDLEDVYGDVLDVWAPWAKRKITGAGITSGHHMAEEAPVELAKLLRAFFREI